VGKPGQILGFDRAGEWTTCSIRLDLGDLLVLYTDGVTDAGSRGERFGEIRLARTLNGARSAGDAVARIDRALAAFAPGPHRDDTAVIAVERARVPIAAGPPGSGSGPAVAISPP
jgi:sigma-B regulation protein RsbU (phosphoserine phosphatase)